MHRIVLRPWQKRALEQLAATPLDDFLAVATPGAGKTTFALTAAVQHLAEHPHRRVVVVAPTSHLKVQWAKAAARLGLHLAPSWTLRDGRLPADMHGIVVTYQQVATSPTPLRPLATDAFVILDEVHHAGEDRAWGDALLEAFGGAARRLSISGTPFRSDTTAIPFVRYDFDEAQADFTYGYAEALAEGGVVRPVYFPRLNGQMEWTAADGSHHASTFDDPLDIARSNQRLRTALSLHGEWLPTVLQRASERLVDIRRSQPDAGGLVIAMDQEHARGIAELLRDRCGTTATVAVSEDADASARIARFAGSTDPWIVAVRMVSEGVDIPRLRVGVFATNTTTELFFRQAVGRLVRWTRGVRRQQAYLYIPDDKRLRTFAAQIAEQRAHSLRRRADDADERPEAEQAAQLPGEEEQLSLFAAISAVALDTPAPEDAFDADGADLADPPDLADDSLVLALAPPPLRVASDGGEAATATLAMTRAEYKEDLRVRNADRARALAQLTGLGHAKVNAELNRLSGVRRISEATVAQLEARLEQADRWLRRV